MIHARSDYNRFQDPAIADPSLLPDGSTPIGEDEPVFLLRAQDKHFRAMLRYYSSLVGSDSPEMCARLVQHHKLATEWQATHRTKTPDVPEGVA